MKKLLYTFLAVSIIFSACEKEEEETNNNNNSALAIGDTHQGGIIFYLDANGGGLIAAPTDSDSAVVWGCDGYAIIGADGTAIGTGNQNTIDIEVGCTKYGTAADICANLTLGGYSDWFLPSKDELNEMYLNIGLGSSLGNIGNFIGDGKVLLYWSSSQVSANYAWWQELSGGAQYTSGDATKDGTFYVRAVRAF
jgi:hypothetical protein